MHKALKPLRFFLIIFVTFLLACNTKRSRELKLTSFIKNNFDTTSTYCFNDGEKEIIFYFPVMKGDTCIFSYYYFKNNAFIDPIHYNFDSNTGKLPLFFNEMFELWERKLYYRDSVYNIHHVPGKIHVYAYKNYSRLDVPQGNRFKEEIFDSVKITKDISYGSAPGLWKSQAYHGKNELEVIIERLRIAFSTEGMLDLGFDMYEPHGDGTKKRPVIVFFHDGAFWAGDKADETAKALGNEWAKRGYVFISADYRLGFKTIPALFRLPNQLERSAYKAIQDGRAAIRYLVHHANKFRVDTSNIFLSGASAGAIVALNIAFMDEDEKPESAGSFFEINEDYSLLPDLGCLDCSTNKIDEEFSVKGVINMWGAVADTTLIDEYVPVLSFHGDKDEIVPFGYAYPYNKFRVGISKYFSSMVFGSKFIDERLKVMKIPSQLVVFKDFLHSPHLDDSSHFNRNFDTIIEQSVRFLYHNLEDKIRIKGNRYLASNNKLQSYSIAPIEDKTIVWRVKGGRILGCTANRNRVWVQWFEGDQKRILRAELANRYNIITSDSIVINPEVLF